MKKSHWVILTVVLLILTDQIIKIWVKTNMTYGQEFNILGLEWAKFHFVENEGMAFGWEFGGKIGKLCLSLFRIGAVGVLIYIIRKMLIEKEPLGLILCFSLILAGAIGNIIDSAFYGLLFSETSFGQVAKFLPETPSSRGFLFGKVVDMFHFPMIDTHLPEWIPSLGGSRFQFFRPVFNFADASITVGVTLIILLYRSIIFSKNEKVTTSEVKPPIAAISGDSEE